MSHPNRAATRRGQLAPLNPSIASNPPNDLDHSKPAPGPLAISTAKAVVGANPIAAPAPSKLAPIGGPAMVPASLQLVPTREFGAASDAWRACSPGKENKASDALISWWPSAAPVLRRTSPSSFGSGGGVPLSLSLEAYIRREYNQFLAAHPHCKRRDTLRIFREAFAVFIDHFPEFRSVLSLIQAEYDAVHDEAEGATRRLAELELGRRQAKDREALERHQLLDATNATVQNVQSQLQAALSENQRLASDIELSRIERDRLRHELETNKCQFSSAVERAKLLSIAVTEEAARTQQALVRLRKAETEVTKLSGTVALLRENVAEAEVMLRRRRQRFQGSVLSEAMGMRSNRSRASELTESSVSRHSTSEEAPAMLILNSASGATSMQTEAQLRVTIDDLRMELTRLRSSTKNMSIPCKSTEGEVVESAEEQNPAPLSCETLQEGPSRSDVGTARATSEVCVWGISPAMLRPTPLVPRGRGPAVPNYLKAAQLIRDKRLPQSAVARLIRQFWATRAEGSRQKSVGDCFSEWLLAKTGSATGAVQLSYNIIRVAESSPDNSDCATFLRVLNGLVAEGILEIQNRQREKIRQLCEEALAALPPDVVNSSDVEKLPREVFVTTLRQAFPAKSTNAMVWLRYHAALANNGSDEVNLAATINATDSPFVNTLRLQALNESELLVMQISEVLRCRLDLHTRNIGATDALEAVRSLKLGLSEDAIAGAIATAGQTTVADLRRSGDSMVFDGERLISRLQSTVAFELPSEGDTAVCEDDEDAF